MWRVILINEGFLEVHPKNNNFFLTDWQTTTYDRDWNKIKVNYRIFFIWMQSLSKVFVCQWIWIKSFYYSLGVLLRSPRWLKLHTTYMKKLIVFSCKLAKFYRYKYIGCQKIITTLAAYSSGPVALPTSVYK